MEHAGLPRADDRLRARLGTELAEDVAQVELDRLDGDAQQVRDLPVAPSCRDQLKHLQFPIGQLLEQELLAG